MTIKGWYAIKPNNLTHFKQINSSYSAATSKVLQANEVQNQI